MNETTQNRKKLMKKLSKGLLVSTPMVVAAFSMSQIASAAPGNCPAGSTFSGGICLVTSSSTSTYQGSTYQGSTYQAQPEAAGEAEASSYGSGTAEAKGEAEASSYGSGTVHQAKGEAEASSYGSGTVKPKGEAEGASYGSGVDKAAGEAEATGKSYGSGVVDGAVDKAKGEAESSAKKAVKKRYGS